MWGVARQDGGSCQCTTCWRRPLPPEGLGHVALPIADGVIVRRRDQHRLLRARVEAPRDVENAIGVAADRGHEPGYTRLRHVVDEDVPRRTSRREEVAVGIERHAFDLVVLQLLDLSCVDAMHHLPAPRIPNADGAVVGACRQKLRAGRVVQADDVVGVQRERPEDGLVAHVPDPDLVVEAATGHEVLVLLTQEFAAIDTFLVLGQLPEDHAGVVVPDDDLRIVRCGAHHLLPRVEVDAVHLIVMTMQLFVQLAAVRLPNVDALVARGATQDGVRVLRERDGVKAAHLVLLVGREGAELLVPRQVEELDGPIP
mmetsp:Transcript_26299/g.52592  ORF Transcript_26299/g.52592 Transcript_26299/m.52592 type:complete len:313 (+) Transcript_26299:105-1043(+)